MVASVGIRKTGPTNNKLQMNGGIMWYHLSVLVNFNGQLNASTVPWEENLNEELSI